jgi:large repetitive protein
VDKAGIVYQADTLYSGGGTYRTAVSIGGTEDGVLYQSERFGNFAYNIPVPNGSYTVTLKFAEIYHSYTGARVFDVKVEGKEVISNLDIYAKVGKNKAYDVTIPVSVTDGVLNIEFKADVDSAKVGAIAVYRGEGPSPLVITATAGAGGMINPQGAITVSSGANQTFTITANSGFHVLDVKADGVSQGPILAYTFTSVSANHTIEATFAPDSAGGQPVFAVNCGGPQYVDKVGVVYKADTQYTGGSTYKTTAPIGGTSDNVLYQSERYGDFSYNIPVPNGNYSVTLKFAEIYYSWAEARVFNVKMEGKEVISNLDIFAKAGKNKAYDVTIPVSVTDGVLNIEFMSKKDNAKVNGMLIGRQ